MHKDLSKLFKYDNYIKSNFITTHPSALKFLNGKKSDDLAPITTFILFEDNPLQIIFLFSHCFSFLIYYLDIHRLIFV